MKKFKVYSLDQANDVLIESKHKYIELCFDISSDDFFIFAGEWCNKGAKISKEDHFIIKMRTTSTK